MYILFGPKVLVPVCLLPFRVVQVLHQMQGRWCTTTSYLLASTPVPLVKRSFSVSTRRASSPLPAASNDLRQLMRKVAQPVAVITCNLHDLHNVGKPGTFGVVQSV
jgi:hypothetical protein